MISTKKAVIIGAGQIGRGFIGALLEKNGYHVVFADINEDIIRSLQDEKEYRVHILGKESRHETVTNISAVSVLSPKFITECSECDLICTSVGLNAIPKLAPAIAAGISSRAIKSSEKPLNVIACENGIRVSTILKKHVYKLLNKYEKDYADEHVGFPDCAVDRIIPANQPGRINDIFTEAYSEWDVERCGFCSSVPEIKGMNIVENLDAFLERKLFMLNGPNAVTACCGYLFGYSSINEALTDNKIYKNVTGMMEECSLMLQKRHGFSSPELTQYAEKLIERFTNPRIIDSCKRVARDPLRKLSGNDRIIKPMRYAHEYGIDTPFYYKGIAAVLSYDNREDKESCEMQEFLKSTDFRSAVCKITSLSPDSRSVAEIEKEYTELAEMKGKL